MGKLLILTNSSDGLYSFRNELLQKLLQEHTVMVSLPDDLFVKELKEEGVEVITTPMSRRGMNPFQDLKLYFAYRKLIKENRPDLVLLYTIKPNIYGGMACRGRKVPYMATVTGLGSTFQKEGFLKKMIVTMYRMGLKKAKCIFFQNEENRQVFSDYRILGEKSILVAGSGVNLNKHTPEPYPETDETRFLFVGRIMKEKGIEEFLAAAEALKDEKTFFEVVGYYDENYRQDMEDAVNKGIITYHGFQQNVHDFIKNASALVLPTYHEGMSNVLMEAGATARPVIASNISGCREIFTDGVTGFACEPQNAESLMEAMKHFLLLNREQRAEMGQKAREKMEREFDRNAIIDVYINEMKKYLTK